MKKALFLLLVVLVLSTCGQIWYDLGKTKAQIINDHGRPTEAEPTYFIYHEVSSEGPLDLVIVFKDDIAVTVGWSTNPYNLVGVESVLKYWNAQLTAYGFIEYSINEKGMMYTKGALKCFVSRPKRVREGGFQISQTFMY